MKQPVFDLDDAHAAAFCPACGAGYTAGSARCADCGEKLLPRSEIEARLTVAGEDTLQASLEETVPEETVGEPAEFDLSDPDAVAFCPSCGSGYRAGPVRCAECDRELLPRSWVEARAREPAVEPSAVDTPVLLTDIGNSFKAHLLGSVLNDEGIWFATEPSSMGAVRFLVLPRDLDVARQVVSDLDESQKSLELPEES